MKSISLYPNSRWIILLCSIAKTNLGSIFHFYTSRCDWICICSYLLKAVVKKHYRFFTCSECFEWPSPFKYLLWSNISMFQENKCNELWSNSHWRLWTITHWKCKTNTISILMHQMHISTKDAQAEKVGNPKKKNVTRCVWETQMPPRVTNSYWQQCLFVKDFEK
jgi:hypothetical protein